MNNLGAVFWDVDGTISDTELNGHRLAFNRAFNQVELPWVWDRKTYIDLLEISGGRKRVQYYADLVNFKLHPNLLDQIINQKKSNYIKIVNSGSLQFRPGVKRLTEELSSKSISQYIVTTSSRSSAKNLINNLYTNKSSPFDGIVAFEDVDNHKPSPDAYLKATSLTTHNLNSCIVIEDSVIGMHSAIKAGIPCLITLSPWLSNPPTAMVHAKAVLDHLGEYNLKVKCFSGPKPLEHIVNAAYLKKLIN